MCTSYLNPPCKVTPALPQGISVIANPWNEWWRIRDLNPGPTDYDSAALTTELIRHGVLEGDGILPLDKFSVKIYKDLHSIFTGKNETLNLAYKFFYMEDSPPTPLYLS